MFDKQQIKELKREISDLSDQNKALSFALSDKELEIKEMRAANASSSRIKDNEINTMISEATTKKDREITSLTIKCNALEKEVAILNKAFENMGFDVKDMKDILNKLVDGLIAKNGINLIKS